MNSRLRLLTRRDLMQMAGAAALLSGCDVLLLDGTTEEIDPITETKDFYQYQHGAVPFDDIDSWSFTVSVLGEDVATIHTDDVLAMSGEEIEYTLICIGTDERNQRISNGLWTARPLLDVLDEMGVTIPDQARDVLLEGLDGYYTAVPLSDLEKAWFVWELNGEALPVKHGFPARLLIPGRYGVKNVKWITGLRISDADQVGYWEERRWAKDGDILASTLVAWPISSSAVELGSTVRMVGIAYAGEDPVTKVEILVEGQTHEAELTYAPGPNRWVLWSFDWKPSNKGKIKLQARCTTESGDQSAGETPTRIKDGWDASMAVEVKVS